MTPVCKGSPFGEKEVMKIQVIKTVEGVCFLTDNLKDSSYFTSKLPKLIFDGEKVKPTFHKNWYYLESFPSKIQVEVEGEITNRRYLLQERFQGAKNLPTEIKYEDRDNYLELDEEYFDLYNYHFDRGDSSLVDVEVVWEVLCVVSDFKESPLFSYDAIRSSGFQDSVYKVTNVDIQHSIIDKMLLPAPLLGGKPCKISSNKMYDIIRQHVRENINNSVARISSDYDFCFAVDKIVQLSEPETVNYQNIFATKKKDRAKWHTTVHKSKKVKIFEMTSERSKYQGYPIIEGLTANSEWELKEKLDTFLEELMKKINEPLEECECCKGTGYKDAVLVKKAY